MYYAALVTSSQLARTHGPYEIFWTSPAAGGELQFDMWGVTPDDDMWDWAALKRDIRKTGLRNSLLIAQMPTAGTSIISGLTESVEVPQINVYTRSTLSGRFQLVNKHLVRALKSIGLWTPSIRSKIIANDGSVQGIAEIPEHIRSVYKTIYEYKLSTFIKMDAARGAFICQSNSSNRYLNTPDMMVLTNTHLYAWKCGLKCSSYYVRIRQIATGKKFGDDASGGCVGCSA
ncbi:hypothetical protein PC123_g24571 [Phytophthora cactorum]|nr:hypothetical protein PC123_g24571 [Phytophthora cactorum]